ncbi:hypothetical protein BSL78_19999 [Apostichopus japonicus]|uniref:DNA2/NAM7 helicase helicase domain-containing protein n=1 Tax=Stichopus japonicus TaxID=307972 RepID=A0A2G8K5B9_STIJA|nr:hypothetical protein BSL78_19999 [Apostichopus japonicus]
MDAWTPLLKMLIAYTTIINDETIVIHGISINWFKKDGSVCGHFTLEKKWCDDRQIILSVLQTKKKGRKSDPPEPSKKRIAGTTNIGRPSDTENYDVEFQVTQKSCELPDELFDNQEPVTCTVELIPKTEPEKRTSNNIGSWKRKLDNKDVFVRRSNVDNTSLNDSQKKAVQLALSQPFTVIQGPPGTGKTRTGAYLTVLLADINREVKNKKQVLYCGPSKQVSGCHCK